MIGLIAGGGTPVDTEQFLHEFERADFTICADGGAGQFLSANVYPDLLLGDFDSIAPKDLVLMQEAGVPVVRHPAKKDDTDMALAVRQMEKRGIRTIRMLGATGTRMDHTLANLSLIVSLQERGIHLTILDAWNQISPLCTETVDKWGTYLSVLPMDESVTVTLEGVKYPLQSHKIVRGSSLGVSNEIEAGHARIILHKGRGLLMQSKDH